MCACKPLLQIDTSDFSPIPQGPFHDDFFLFSLTVRNLALIYNIFSSFSSLVYTHKVVLELLTHTFVRNILTNWRTVFVYSSFGLQHYNILSRDCCPDLPRSLLFSHPFSVIMLFICNRVK